MPSALLGSGASAQNKTDRCGLRPHRAARANRQKATGLTEAEMQKTAVASSDLIWAEGERWEGLPGAAPALLGWECCAQPSGCWRGAPSQPGPAQDGAHHGSGAPSISEAGDLPHSKVRLPASAPSIALRPGPGWEPGGPQACFSPSGAR